MAKPVLSKVEIMTVSTQTREKQVYVLRISAHTLTEDIGPADSVNYYHNLSAVVIGRAIVELDTVGSPDIVSSKEEERLLSVLVGRATQTRLGF